MEWAFMVVAIVAIVTFGKIYSARHGLGHDRHGNPVPVRDPDAARMREEIKVLKDRIAVLERLATDNRQSLDLDREIEQLRGRG